MRNAFDPGDDAGFVQILDDPVGDRADMALRPAGSNDHVVADRRFVPQIDGEGVLRLHIVEAGRGPNGGSPRRQDAFWRPVRARDVRPEEITGVDRGPYPFAPFSDPGHRVRAVTKIGTQG